MSIQTTPLLARKFTLNVAYETLSLGSNKLSHEPILHALKRKSQRNAQRERSRTRSEGMGHLRKHGHCDGPRPSMTGLTCPTSRNTSLTCTPAQSAAANERITTGECNSTGGDIPLISPYRRRSSFMTVCEGLMPSIREGRSAGNAWSAVSRVRHSFGGVLPTFRLSEGVYPSSRATRPH